jgi:hypothetical protein
VSAQRATLAPVRGGKARSAFLERSRGHFHDASITNDKFAAAITFAVVPKIEIDEGV